MTEIRRKASLCTADQDELLRELFSIYNNSWSSIARFIPGKPADQIYNRFCVLKEDDREPLKFTTVQDAEISSIVDIELNSEVHRVARKIDRFSLAIRRRYAELQQAREFYENPVYSEPNSHVPGNAAERSMYAHRLPNAARSQRAPESQAI